jgi:hypothetical protein
MSFRFGTDGSMVRPDYEVVVTLDDEDIATVIHALVIARVALRGEPDRRTAREWEARMITALDKFTLIRKQQEEEDAEPAEAPAQAEQQDRQGREEAAPLDEG